MKTPLIKQVALSLFVSAIACTARADGITNTFDASCDYVANGIIGDTNWDGVYLGYGDIPYGNADGNGNGSTPIAGTTTYPGYLGLRNVGGDWAWEGDDGFFLYKVVSGDFDVAVESSPYTLDGGTWFDNRGYHMAGLMVRAYNPNNSGAPYSTTSTNAVENYVMLLRFQEWDLDEINEARDGVRSEHIFYDSQNDTTNASRFYRIVRTAETNFTFYWKTNLSDSWAQITSDLPGGVLTRSDLTGPLQVGIAECAFNTEPRDAVFDNFELTGTNVSFPAMPAAPSGLTFSSPNTSGSVTLSWTPGGDGSLVVMRQNGPLIANPINGINYTADTDFKNANTLMGADRTHVVYVGSGNSVTVTGLGGSNNTYSAAVFSYSTSSPPVYNTASPATNSTIGPGKVSAVSFTVAPTSLPRGGVALATVTATYTSGDSYDVSADLSTIWNSSDPSIIIATTGTLTAVTNGSAAITATYAGITGTNVVSVVNPAFTDNFDVNHDYVASGVPGTKWDGLYSRPGDVPGAASGGTVVFTTTANANISSNNVLSVAAGGAEWEGGNDDGFFLFKNVPGDFQAVVHINYTEKGAWEFTGLMARAAEASGAPFGGSEDRVNWWFFGHPEWGAATCARWAVDGAENYADQGSGPADTVWLLLQRMNGTNFYCYQKVNATDPWTLMPGATMVQPNLTIGVPVQVGLAESTFTAEPALLVQFDSFMLHGDGITVGTPPSGSPTGFTNSVDLANGTITLTWTNAPGSDGSIVVVRANSPINVAPMSGVTYTANAAFGLGSDLGSSNYVVYAGSGNSVTVNNLAGGKTYYASIFAYTNSSGVLIYNQQTTAAIQSAFVGVLEDIVLTVSGNSQIPLDGVGIAHVTALYSGGGTLNVTATATLTCENPSVIVITNVNNLDAIALGTASIAAVYLNKTNTVLVTVRNPTYTDNFATSHNYLANGVAGTMWDGVYFGSPVNHPANSIPNGSGIGAGNGQTFSCDANTTSNGVLSVQTTQTDWEWANDDGFLLFKNVPGDFQVRIHITTSDTAGFPPQFHLNCGVMARQFGPGGAPSGGALGTNENWVSWSRFDLWGIQTDGRSATADGDTRHYENRDGSTNYWLLLVKDGADFHFFEKEYPTNLWIERFPGSVVRPDLIGAMQVGIQQATFSDAIIMSQFDSLMLDAAPAVLQVSRSGNNVDLTWPNMPGVVLKSTVSLNPTDWQTVSGTPTLNGGVLTISLPMTNAASFFRLFN